MYICSSINTYGKISAPQYFFFRVGNDDGGYGLGENTQWKTEEMLMGHKLPLRTRTQKTKNNKRGDLFLFGYKHNITK